RDHVVRRHGLAVAATHARLPVAAAAGQGQHAFAEWRAAAGLEGLKDGHHGHPGAQVRMPAHTIFATRLIARRSPHHTPAPKATPTTTATQSSLICHLP